VETAARILSAGLVLLEVVGSREDWAERMNEKTLAAIRSQLDEAAISQASEHGRKLTADEAVALALESVGDPDARTTVRSRPGAQKAGI
jgi:hypothetical protein